MSDRVVTKIFCGQNHRIGTVLADEAGLRVEFRQAIHGDGGQWVPETWRSTEGVESAEAWCGHCRKRYPLMLSTVVSGGEREIHLTAEGMWLDPMRVLNRKPQR